MAIPKKLKRISEAEALDILVKHPEGYWEYSPFVGDFIYNGRMTKHGRRKEMLRPLGRCPCDWEWGVVAG